MSGIIRAMPKTGAVMACFLAFLQLISDQTKRQWIKNIMYKTGNENDSIKCN